MNPEIPPFTLESFQYKPLASPSCIRLLSFVRRPAAGTCPVSICGHKLIECAIRHVDLADNPMYDALSYTWGNPKAVEADLTDGYAIANKWPIIANGRLLYVTKSLHEALVELNKGAPPDREGIDKTCPPYNKTELIRAAEEGRLAAVQSAIQRGASLTTQDGFGETALHYAAENGYLDIVKTLLEHGADRERIDYSGRTPLACCLQRKRRQFAQVANMLRDPSSVQKVDTTSVASTRYSTSRNLWIDAVCINQEDIDERNAQVSMMAQIYSSARSSIVWLGPEDETTCIARDAVTRLNMAPFQDARAAAWRFINKSHQDLTQEGIGGISAWHVQSVLNLIRRSWFGRTWVLQEVVLAKEIEILCGSHRFTWTELFELIQHRLGHDEDVHIMGLPEHPNSNRAKGAKGTGAWVMTDLRLRLRLDTLERHHFKPIENVEGQVGHSWDDKLSLCTVLVLTWNLEVTDPRDKVFALLSIAAPLEPSAKIAVDYRRSTVDVFTDLGRIFVEARGNNKIQSFHSGIIEEFEPLEGMSFVQAPLCEDGNCNRLPSCSRNERPDALPSWVPAFNMPLTTGRLWRTGFAAAFARGPIFFHSDAAVLKLEGCEFDRIIQLEEKPHEKEIGDGVSFDIFSWLKMVQLRGPNVSGPSQMEVLWRTLMLNHFWGGGLEAAKASFRSFISQNLPMSAHPSKQSEANLRLYSTYQAADNSESLPTLQEIMKSRENLTGHVCRHDGISEVSNFHSAFCRHYRTRRLFRTEKGRLGLGPRTAREGDTVWLLSGARTPFILRSLQGHHGNGQSSLIGEAYVHGAMDGYLAHAMESEFKPVQIV